MGTFKRITTDQLEISFYESQKEYGRKAYLIEFDIEPPTDAVRMFVFDDSHTIFKLRSKKYMVLVDGNEKDFKCLEEAKKELWAEFNRELIPYSDTRVMF